MRLPALIVALLISELAQAAPSDTAREHFQRGESLYEATRYEAALREFEAARSLESSKPALLYDIALCLDRLGRREEAAKAYEQFLTEEPTTPNAAEVRARIAELNTESAPPAVAPIQEIAVQLPRSSLQPSPWRYLLPGVVGGATLALAVTGAGLLGSVAGTYHSLDASCAPTCERNSWASLPAREHAGEALLGLAAAVAVVDVVLFVRAMRRK